MDHFPSVGWLSFRAARPVVDALDRLGPAFTKQDLCRVLGFTPTRTTLHSVLEYLVNDGTLTLAHRGWGSANRYQQGPPLPSDPGPPAGGD